MPRLHKTQMLLRHRDRKPQTHAKQKGQSMATASNTSRGHAQTFVPEQLNAQVLSTKYEVRGEIYLAAQKRAAEGKEVILTNVGNPHALGQRPLTFNRYVMALCMAPFMLEDPVLVERFPADVVARARLYLQNIGGGIGAYSDSKGNGYIRQVVSQFIQDRDGVPSNPDHIFLTNGASEAIRMVLNAVIRGPGDGIMVPIPQYPLYSASVTLYNGTLVPYYLDEDNTWAMNIGELERSIQEARTKGISVRALVFINPGNPTGQCLSAQNLQELLAFCHRHNLLVLADEVYQENVYVPGREFVSAKKALHDMGAPFANEVELASFHTVSKGVYGECGLRGGYMELINISEGTITQLYKMSSINLSPNVPGQVAMALMCHPPRVGDPSYEQHAQEKQALFRSLQNRARRITDAFNSMEGVTCQETEGALYSFPRITLPPAAIEAAKRLGKAPDVLYCLELLQETGLSCVPGSGFDQVPGTFHLRTTILPAEDTFDDIIGRFSSFHRNFLAKYGGLDNRARL